jgi:hypothetical protein
MMLVHFFTDSREIHNNNKNNKNNTTIIINPAHVIM